jgi:hypothetical protein
MERSPNGIPRDVDSALTEPLGQIVIMWAALEGWISMLLAHMLQADSGSIQVMTNAVSTSTQSKWIRDLMALHPNEATSNQRVAELLNWADDLRAERNEFVHGIWDTTNCEPNTALIQTINLQRAEVIRERLVTPPDLDQFVIEIKDWIAAYAELGRELGFPRRRGETKSLFAD